MNYCSLEMKLLGNYCTVWWLIIHIYCICRVIFHTERHHCSFTVFTCRLESIIHKGCILCFQRSLWCYLNIFITLYFIDTCTCIYCTVLDGKSHIPVHVVSDPIKVNQSNYLLPNTFISAPFENEAQVWYGELVI